MMCFKHLFLTFAFLIAMDYCGFSTAALGQSQKEALAAYNKGHKLWQEGKYPEALAELETALRLYQRLKGEASLDVADCCDTLGNVVRTMGQYGRAESLIRRGLDIREAKLGQYHHDTAISLNSLALLYQYMGRYTQAEPLYRRGLDIVETKLGKDHPETATSLNNLANLYQIMGQYAKAEPLYHRSLRIREAKLGKDHPDTANSLSNLALLYQTMGQYTKAEPLCRRSLDIHETKLGKDHPFTADSLNNLAMLYHSIGQYAKAEPLFRRSLEIYEIKFGKDHPATADSLNNLAELYRTLRQYERAEPLYRRSLDISEARLGKEHPDTANALNNLANLFQNTGQYAKAEPLLRRSLEICETRLGSDHPLTATALNNLALLLDDTKQYAKAAPLFRRSLAIRASKLGNGHPETAQSLNNLAWLHCYQQEWRAAVDMVHQARQVSASHLAHILPVLTENEQMNLIEASFEWAFHRSLSLGYAAPADAVTKSAEWLLNGKALGHQSLAEQQILARDAKEPQAKQLVEDLHNSRALLASLLNSHPQPGQVKEHQQQMHDLRTREQDLAGKLARAVGRPYRSNVWVGLDELRGKLDARSVFIDIARFDPINFTTDKRQGPRYVAWITPPQGKGEVQLIDLGDAESIDRCIAEVRELVAEAPKKKEFPNSVLALGEPGALKILNKPLQELSAKVLHPLLPAIEKYHEWIISPDGALWLTPWNALFLKDGKHAIENHQIRHVVSGRDLVLELPKTRADSAYVVANPDYDLNPAQVIAATGGLRGIGATGLLGQRLHGGIGSWNISLEFLENDVVIRDEDNKSQVVGRGTWKLQGDTLTIETALSRFTATKKGNEFKGQRNSRNADGTVNSENFRIESPRIDEEEARDIGTARRIIPRVTRLPGTALEAEEIRPKLEQWLGQKPKVYLDGQASETLVKSIRNPRILTLATHGYFLPTQEVEAKDRSGLDFGDTKRPGILLDKKGQPIENPLLRCGLLFAGCNKRAEAKPGEDDGILTGLEIVGMNLQGCELVVLSACETGLGDVRNGEGVAGLRQAFQLAGAKGVLASLWQVPDRETALLMNAFYGELAKGRSQAEALRLAQLERIEARRRQFGAAHPFFWAAFTLTNRGIE